MPKNFGKTFSDVCDLGNLRFFSKRCPWSLFMARPGNGTSGNSINTSWLMGCPHQNISQAKGDQGGKISKKQVLASEQPHKYNTIDYIYNNNTCLDPGLHCTWKLSSWNVGRNLCYSESCELVLWHNHHLKLSEHSVLIIQGWGRC